MLLGIPKILLPSLHNIKMSEARSLLQLLYRSITMGGSASKSSTTPQTPSKLDQFRSTVEDEIARRMMLQREIQMAVNIARARDTLFIFGSAWGTLVTGVVTARALGRTVPGVVGVPIVVGALALGNMADMAYGNKLQRVSKEAEYIMEFERERFVPAKQAPFAKFYTAQERQLFDDATRVSALYPNAAFVASKK